MSVEGIANAGANAALDNAISGTVWVQLHTGHPGAAGTTSIATNSTRKSCTFAAAAGGVKATNSDLLWSSVPATETYAYFTLWSASTGGTFLWSGSISGGGVTLGQDFDVASGQLSVSFAEAA